MALYLFYATVGKSWRKNQQKGSYTFSLRENAPGYLNLSLGRAVSRITHSDLWNGPKNKRQWRL